MTRDSTGDFETALAAAMRRARERVSDKPVPEASAPEPIAPAVEPEPEDSSAAVSALVDAAAAGVQAPRRETHASPRDREVAVAAARVLIDDHRQNRTYSAGLVAEALGVSTKSVLNWLDRADVAALPAETAAATPPPRRPSAPQVRGRLNVALERESISTHFSYDA